MSKEELNEQNLDMVTGGAKESVKVDQNIIGNKKHVQQSNVNGKNEIKAVQYNTVKGNTGKVTINGPINLENTNGPVNLTFN